LYRVDNSATRTIGGTGLGLFICRKIIELYSGQIWAESKVGEGSTFYFNLPRLDNQKAAKLQATETNQAETVA
jgi:two-component system sensor histidine kinase VicK